MYNEYKQLHNFDNKIIKKRRVYLTLQIFFTINKISVCTTGMLKLSTIM